MSFDRVAKLKQDIESAFGTVLSPEQLWTLVKLCKHIRLRGKNNSAFNNRMNELFPYANFREVMKQKPNGERYPGLQITVNGKVAEQEQEEE